MEIAAQAILLPPDDQQDLAVGFESRQAVEDMAASSLSAQWMLFSSSKRALSSTSTVTCLPLSAAFIRAAMMGDWPLTR